MDELTLLETLDAWKEEHRNSRCISGWFYCQCDLSRRIREIWKSHDVIALRIKKSKQGAARDIRTMEKVPDFHASNEEALADIRACAEKEKAII